MPIEVRHLTHTYSQGSAFQATAIMDVNLTIQDGEFIGVIGHTGSGKSTLVRCINLLERPTEGEVLSLVPAGKSAGGIYGWDFKWGTTGLCPLGGGYFYISQNARSKETKQQSSTVRLYRWTGDADAPFRPVE